MADELDKEISSGSDEIQKSFEGQSAPLIYCKRSNVGQNAPVNPPKKQSPQPSNGQKDGKKG